jgi:hypothetical protein
MQLPSHNHGKIKHRHKNINVRDKSKNRNPTSQKHCSEENHLQLNETQKHELNPNEALIGRTFSAPYLLTTGFVRPFVPMPITPATVNTMPT